MFSSSPPRLQEKVDRAASCYPELHYNRATLFQYEEMFGSALDGYTRAAALDPGWEDARVREKQLLEYLRKVTELIQNKVWRKTHYGNSRIRKPANRSCLRSWNSGLFCTFCLKVFKSKWLSINQFSSYMIYHETIIALVDSLKIKTSV